MQEQPTYKTTPEKGWANMQRILEREMPVNRRSRRISFIWWTSSFLLVTSVVGLSLFKGNIVLSKTPATSTPVIEIPADVKNKADEHRTTPPDIASGEYDTESANVKVTANPAINQELSVHENSTHSSMKNKSHAGGTNLTPQHVNMQRNQSGAIAVTSEITNSQSKFVSAGSGGEFAEMTPEEPSSGALEANEKTSTDAMRDGQVVSSLPVITYSSLDIPTGVIEPGSISYHKKKSVVLEPGAEVSTFFGQQGGMGTYAGLGLDINLGRRWAIVTAAGYRSFQPEASLFGSSNDLALTPEFNAILQNDPIYGDNNPYIPGADLNNAAGYTAINPLIQSLHQWQVSAGMKWSASRHFFLEGGMAFGFKTTASSEYPIVTVDFSSTSPTNIKIANSFDHFNVIRSTMTSFYAGAGYEIGEHVQLFGRWMHGLNSYLLTDINSVNVDTSTERKDYLRGLSLGLRFHL